MEGIINNVLSVLVLVNAVLVIYWVKKCDTYRRTITAILANQKLNWHRLLTLELENSELKAKLKELKEGVE